jgi:hypothetical protein
MGYWKGVGDMWAVGRSVWSERSPLRSRLVHGSCMSKLGVDVLTQTMYMYADLLAVVY